MTELGRQLRRKRLERGLSQRALTRLIGLSAHSNIADYESGRRLPPRDIVEQCDRVLQTGGELTQTLTRELAHRAAEAQCATEALPAATELTAIPSAPATPRRRLAALVVLVASGVGLLGLAQLSPGLPAAPTSQVWDGNDPKAAGCSDDATSLDAQPIHDHATNAQLGTVHLRYSPRCRAAWAKFEPLPATTPADGQVMVIVEALRPADGMRTVFHYPGLSQIYGDLLLTGPGCVQASATVQGASALEATGSTACLTPAPTAN